MSVVTDILKKTVTKVIIVILIILFTVSLYFCWGWYERQIKKVGGYYYVYKGDKAYKAGKYQKAVDYYMKGLSYYPEHSKARCNLGHLYVVYENYYAAAEAYEEALKYDPDYMTCRMDYGIILAERLSDYDRAVQQYGKVLNSKPFVLNIPFIYNNATSVKQNRGLAYYNMGLAYRGKSVYMGEQTLASVQYLNKAKQAYSDAVKFIPENYDNYYNAALTNHLLGNTKDAGLCYCKAIELNPYNFEAHYNYALLLQSLNFNREALSELEKAGMLCDGANVGQSKYIFQVLGEVKQSIINSDDRKFLETRTEESATDNSELAYRNGKVILKKDSDKILTEKLKRCPKKKYFEEL